jgi:hypothetical protein
VYVPGWVNVNAKDAPVESESDEKGAGEPVSETMVCGAPSWFTHVTTVPVFAVSEDGSNAKFLIVMEFPPVGAGVVVVAGGVWLEVQPATMQARITRAIHDEQNAKREYFDILP